MIILNIIKKGFSKVVAILKDDSGLSVVEMILILVVMSALVMIFKNQLINLVNQIFMKIFNESSGI